MRATDAPKTAHPTAISNFVLELIKCDDSSYHFYFTLEASIGRSSQETAWRGPVLLAGLLGYA